MTITTWRRAPRQREAAQAGLRALIATATLLLLLLLAAPVVAQTQIANTVHNLTPGGPGLVKETRPTGLCSFCHTPHNANPAGALWNRDLPAVTYQLYASSTLRAVPGQPNGSARLCLSCHDGVLALGTLRKPPSGAALKLGPLTGANLLGTDLSDDHPISFVYDSALAVQRPGLVDPRSLPPGIRLDSKQRLQCTSCHDPHEDRRAKFLRLSNLNGALCLSCHRPAQWSASAHASSSATWNGTGTNPWPADAAATVAANACRNCHRSHSAGRGPRLLASSSEPDNCNVCHVGTVAVKNVAAEFASSIKFSRHPIDSAQWTHDPRENPVGMPRHVACADCHNAHAVNSTPAQPPLVSGRLASVAGVTTSGSPITEAENEYQICIKCHGFSEPSTPGIVRAGGTRRVSARIDPSNRSFHPIATPGRNATIQGLLPGYGASSMIACSDCHNNNDWRSPIGTAPKGPHASRFAPILERNYVSNDPSPDSVTSYELCYKCHDRNTLLSDRASAFPHRLHVVEEQTSCAVCHDAHGSRQNAHLIDFMLRDGTGKLVVTANRAGRLEYVSTLPGSGACYLSCHGEQHNPEAYGVGAQASETNSLRRKSLLPR